MLNSIDIGILVCVAVASVSLLSMKLYGPTGKDKKSKTGTLQLVSEVTNAEFELIAVHGLAADPHWTWTQVFPTNADDKPQSPGGKDKHLLHDILKEAFPKARILNFADNSTHLGNESTIKTTEEIGRCLLKEIKRKRLRPALCAPGSETILKHTSGIVFLGTPHQGSSISLLGGILSFLTKPLGSNTTLVMSLTTNNSELSNLRRRFEDVLTQQRRRPRIVSFYETSPTFLGGWLSAGVIVPRDSAIVHADTEYYIDTDHSRLNKCFGANAELRKLLIHCIDKSRDPSLLQQVGRILKTQHYSGKLDIIRLSGKPLPMERCYINLTTVHNCGKCRRALRRLVTLFGKRHRTFGKATPRRILIEGRAGVGKTTLCKKIVHDFLYRGMWNSIFDQVLWIPLRNLKARCGTGYNLKRLFYDEFFSQLWDGEQLADHLWEAVCHDPEKTLFILDGMDEVAQSLGDSGDMAAFLTTLLGQHNAIITTRPNTKLPSGLIVDLELETIGFLDEQVEAYLNADPKYIPRAKEIQSLLEKNSLLRSLVRIPIQLDALCFIWEETDLKNVPETMAGIYNDIAQKLWAKDVVRLGNRSQGDAPPSKTEIEIEAKNEIAILECLAFNGLCNDTIDFSQDDLENTFNYLVRKNPAYKLDSRVNDVLARLSFMRSSDTAQPSTHQSFHFLHLTYQEYFAARWFKRHYQEDQPFSIITPRGIESKSADDFVRKHKYTARFNVMWRFVSGLLDLDLYNRKDIERLFSLFEKEPVDLLGSTHYRILMQCLAEVTKSAELRGRIETQLSMWLEFECNFLGQPQLLCESDFPAGTLTLVFRNASEKTKQVVLKALNGIGDTTQAAFELFPRWLESIESLPALRLYVLKALEGYHEPLSTAVLEATMIQMGDQNQEVSHQASMVLGRQTTLPQKIQNDLLTQRQSDDRNKRDLAEVALKGHLVAQQAVIAWIGDGGRFINRLAAPETTSKSIGGKGSENSPRGTQILSSTQEDPMVDLEAMMAHDSYLFRNRNRDITLLLDDHEFIDPALPTLVIEAITMWVDGQKDVFAKWEPSNDQIRKLNGTPRNSVIEMAVARLRHEDAVVQKRAVNLLKTLSPFSIERCRVISRQLENHDTSQPDLGFGIFFHRDDFAQGIVMTLMEQAENGEGAVKRVVSEILWDLEPPSPKQYDLISQWLSSPEEDVKTMAIYAVIYHLKDARPILRAIASGFRNQDQNAKKSALESLVAIAFDVAAPHDVVRNVAALLTGNPTITKIIFDTLKGFSYRNDLPKDVIIKVAVYLDDEREGVKEMALETLLVQRKRLRMPIIRQILSQFNNQRGLKKILLILLPSKSNGDLPLDLLLALAEEILSHPDSIRDVNALRAFSLTQTLLEGAFGATFYQVCHHSFEREWFLLKALQGRPGLPHHILKLVKDRLQDEDPLIAQHATLVFKSQKTSCPDILLALAKCLDRQSIYPIKEAAAEALCFQPNLDDGTLEAIIEIAKSSQDARFDALKILNKHSPLDDKFMEDVVDLMTDNNWIVRRDAINILGAYRALPAHVLAEITVLALDTASDLREEAISALKRQSTLPDTILKTERLYRLWLLASFQEEIHCYVEDGITYLNKPRDLGRVRLDGDSNVLKSEVHLLRKKFGFTYLD